MTTSALMAQGAFPITPSASTIPICAIKCKGTAGNVTFVDGQGNVVTNYPISVDETLPCLVTKVTSFSGTGLWGFNI